MEMFERACKNRKDCRHGGSMELPFVEVSFSAMDIKPNTAHTRVYCGMQLLYTTGPILPRTFLKM